MKVTAPASCMNIHVLLATLRGPFKGALRLSSESDELYTFGHSARKILYGRRLRVLCGIRRQGPPARARQRQDAIRDSADFEIFKGSRPSLAAAMFQAR